MRKTIYSLIFLLIFFTVPLTVFAQEDSQQGSGVSGQTEPANMIAPDYIVPPSGGDRGIFGQDHSYSVVFRGNGEAVTSARIVFTNRGDQEQKELTLRIPRVEPNNVSAYQIIKEKTCIRYRPLPFPSDPTVNYYTDEYCAQFQEPDYFNYWGASRYQKAKVGVELDTIKITLPTPIKVNQAGSFFVYYRAFGYAKKDIFGAYDFVFETLKTDDEIRQLNVGISTDSDLVLKGVKGEVSYRFAEPAVAQLDSAGFGGEAQKSVAIDRFVQQIGQGQIVKSASNLAPLESYTTKSSFATSRLKLYAQEISIGLLVLVLFSGVSLIIFRIIYKRLKRSEDSTGLSNKKSNSSGGAVNFLLISGLSFLSSLLILGYTFLVFVIGSSMDDIIGYQFQTMFVLLLVVISFIVYSLLLFAPGIYVGAKKGIGWGIAEIVMTLFWLVLVVVFATVVVLLLQPSNNPINIYPAMRTLE